MVQARRGKVICHPFFAGNCNKDEVCFDSMLKKYVGKWILLMAADIYSRGRVPSDKENMLVQYYFVSQSTETSRLLLLRTMTDVSRKVAISL